MTTPYDYAARRLMEANVDMAYAGKDDMSAERLSGEVIFTLEGMRTSTDGPTVSVKLARDFDRNRSFGESERELILGALEILKRLAVETVDSVNERSRQPIEFDYDAAFPERLINSAD